MTRKGWNSPVVYVWGMGLSVASLVFLRAAGTFLAQGDDDILRVVPDDAFYYLQIGRNLAESGRSTADGLATTNGFHPLWMLVITGLAWGTRAAPSLLRMAVGASLAAHAVSALLMAVVLRPVVGSRWAATAACCWLVNPVAYVIAQQGVEASLYGATLLTALATHLAYTKPRDRESRRPVVSIVYGLSLGLVCLARTEGVVILAAAVAAASIDSFRHRSWRSLVSALTTMWAAAVILVPWCIFSIWQVGSIVQDSGAMKALWAADLMPSLADRLRNLRHTGAFVVGRWGEITFGMPPRHAGVLALLVLLAMTFLVKMQERQTAGARACRSILVVACSLWGVYGLMLVEQQLWWLTVPLLSAFLIVFISLQRVLVIAEAADTTRTWVQTGVVFGSIAVFLYPVPVRSNLYPWQPDVRASQMLFEREVEPGARIGCFNAGIPLFFGSTGQVVALDGLVNHRARQAWSTRTLDVFIDQAQIEYVADERRALNRAMRFVRRPLSLTPVASHSLSGWPTGNRILWRIR